MGGSEEGALAAWDGSARFAWVRGEKIGEGTYGRVYKALNMATGGLVAVKQVVLRGGFSDDARSLEREIRVMRDLRHAHIVRYLGSERSADGRCLNILLEYVPGGSIASMLQMFGTFKEDLIQRYTTQVLRGAAYLHSQTIVHRDIKGANVLVTDHGVAKLSDFGCSKQLVGATTASLEESLCAIRGSVPWMAPEVVKMDPHKEPSKADIWSIGCTVIEMATAEQPWPQLTNTMSALCHVANATEPPPFPEDLSREARDFLARCLAVDPDQRDSADQLLAHAFVA